MKIIRYKKVGKGKYKVTLEGNELILYEEVILNNNLLTNKNITIDILNKVLKENIFYEAYNLSLNYITIKLRTKKELKDYLLKKNYDISIIDKVIQRIESEGYINDNLYIESFVNDKVNLSIWGPLKIKKTLVSMELNEELINNKLYSVNSDIWKEKVVKIVNKKLKSIKNKSTYMIKNKLKVDLFNLGYESEVITEVLSDIKFDNNDAINKDYNKCLTKYSKKYSDDELYLKVRNYLYTKGYSLDEINCVMKKIQ